MESIDGTKLKHGLMFFLLIQKNTRGNYFKISKMLQQMVLSSWTSNINVSHKRYLKYMNLKILAREIRVKWWKKFNNSLVSKSKIKGWINNNQQKGGNSQAIILTEEPLFLTEKQKLMAKLATTTSAKELHHMLQKAQSTSRASTRVGSDEDSSQSNPYEDMFD
ncbi:hypothetical protein CR513_15558, partial [Mucuna pruriens]